MLESSTVRPRVMASLLLIAIAGEGRAQTPPARTAPPTQAATQPAGTPMPAYRFRLLGIYDETTGDALEGVEVADALSGVSAPTSKTGTVSLFFLPDGGGLVRMRKLGYEAQTLAISIAPADTAPLTVTLRRAVRQLEAVKITEAAPTYASARLRGAQARLQSHAGGYFIDEAQMRRLDNGSMADALLGKTTGLMKVIGAHGESYFVSSRHPCANPLLGCRKVDCYITVYIDGVVTPVHPDFNNVWPGNYAIAEFYPGGASVPAEFGGMNASCGTLLLWSRER